MTPKTRRTLRFVLIAVALIFFVNEIYAQAPAGWLDRTTDHYKTVTQLWQATMLKYATRLFWMLAGIELTYLGIKLALKGADLQEFVGEFVHFVLVTGFFAALLQFGTTWLPWVVQSFQQIGNEANIAAGGGNAASPSGIIQSIFDAALHAIKTAGIRQLIVALGFGLSILIGGIIIACIMTLAYIEMYVVCNAGLIFFGFGGSRWTRPYATKLITYAVSVGVKLMLIQLIVGIGGSLLTRLTTPVQGMSFAINNTASLLIAVSCIAYLVKAIPQTVQSIINGVDVGTHGFLGQAAGVTKAAAVGGAAIASGGTAAVAAAAKLTMAQNAATMAAGGGGGAGSGGDSGSNGGGGGGGALSAAVGAAAAVKTGGASLAAGAAKTAAAAGTTAAQTGAAAGSAGAAAGAAKTGSAATSPGAAAGKMSLGAKAKAGASFGLQTAGNLFKAAATDLGNKLSGDVSASHGVMGFRMAKNMNEETAGLKSAPASSSPTTPGSSLGKAGSQALDAATSSNQQPQQQTPPEDPANPSQNEQSDHS